MSRGLAVSLFVALGSCTCDPAAVNGTALRIRVNFAAQVSVTQLRFSAIHDGGQLFEPVVRPELPDAILESGGSLLVLMPDALDGQSVTCFVEGLSQGQAVAGDSNVATVKKGYEVSCTVQLTPVSQCDSSTCAGCCVSGVCVAGGDNAACGSGGSECHVCQPGQRCVLGACMCDAASCGGCCSGVTCLDGGSDVLACGKNGASCASCPAPQTCTGGACSCDGGACGTNCNSATCPGGCCSAGTCVTQGPATCGLMGMACADCRTAVSDSCSASGKCVCGSSNNPCAANRHCVNGQCICDNTVCAGCCRGNTCEPGNTSSRCGSDGGTCVNCSSASMVCGPSGACQ